MRNESEQEDLFIRVTIWARVRGYPEPLVECLGGPCEREPEGLAPRAIKSVATVAGVDGCSLLEPDFFNAPRSASASSSERRVNVFVNWDMDLYAREEGAGIGFFAERWRQAAQAELGISFVWANPGYEDRFEMSRLQLRALGEEKRLLGVIEDLPQRVGGRGPRV